MKHQRYSPRKQPSFFGQGLFLVALLLLGSEQFVLAGSLDPAHLKGFHSDIASELYQAPMYLVGRHHQEKLGSRINGNCEGSLAPDQVVISAGLAVESHRPIQGRDVLQKRLDELQGMVKERGGAVVRLEKVRLIQKLARHNKHKGTKKLPYLILQRLEFVFPTKTDVDEVLERLLELGVDRFGKTISPHKRNSNHQVVVYYRFSNLVEQLDRIREDCTQQVVMKWCQHDSPEFPLPECLQTGTGEGARFTTVSLQLSSQPVMVQGYRSRPLNFSYPWEPKRLEQAELFGNIMLELKGKIVVAPILRD